MDPTRQTNTAETESPEPQTHPWQSSQDEPVVHVTPPLESAPPEQKIPEQPKRGKIARLLRSKKFWLGLVGSAVLLFVAAWFVQPARLWIVNVFAGKNTLTISTISPGEGKAKVSQLANVTVLVNGQTYTTDRKGQLTLRHIPYGHVTISAKKAGYKEVDTGAMLDFDPFFHKFGGQKEDAAMRSIELSLTATGMPISFKAVDWLSGQPITVGQFQIGDIVAKPDNQGVVSLKIPGTDAHTVTVSANFSGAYVDKKFDVTLGDGSAPKTTFVPGGKHYFVSKRSGVLTVYASDLDGSHIETIVTGTGQETADIDFSVSSNGKFGVLSSSRDGARNARHDILQRLYVVDLNSKTLRQVDEALDISFADWSGNTLVYTTTNYDASSSMNQMTLRSLDTSNARVYNFESADDIRVGTVAFDKIVYQKTSKTPPDSESSPMLREATINATAIKTLGDQVDDAAYLQLDFDRLAFKTAADQAWHEYNVNTDQLKTVSQPATDDDTLRYLATAHINGDKRLLIQRIDGKYVLSVRDTATNAQKTLYGAGGLSGPIRWIGDVVTYRVATDKETADYAISLNGGEPKKISDVTATIGAQERDFSKRFSLY